MTMTTSGCYKLINDRFEQYIADEIIDILNRQYISDTKAKCKLMMQQIQMFEMKDNYPHRLYFYPDGRKSNELFEDLFYGYIETEKLNKYKNIHSILIKKRMFKNNPKITNDEMIKILKTRDFFINFMHRYFDGEFNI